MRVLLLHEQVAEDVRYLGHARQGKDEGFLGLPEGDGFSVVLVGIVIRRRGVGVLTHVPKLPVAALSK